MNRLNLLPPAIVSRQAAERTRRAWSYALRWYAGALALVVLLAQFPAGADDRTFLPDIERVSRRIETSTKSAESLSTSIAAARKKIEASRAVGDHPDWSVVLKLFESSRQGHGIVLQTLAISTEQVVTAPPPKDAKTKQAPDTEQARVMLVGLADAPAQVLAYVQKLESVQLFDRVTLKDTKPQPFGDVEAVRFELELFMSAPLGVRK